MTLRPALLPLALLFLPALTLADGMLMPGWASIADQALADIRTATLQMHPGDGGTPADPRPEDTAWPAIEAYLAARGGSAEPHTDALVANVWRQHMGGSAGKENGADTVARAFTVGNATSQLAHAIAGGPPGAAAYGAWWAYQQPNTTPTQALRVGLLAAAGLWDTQRTTGAPGQLMQSATLAAALGGLAMAAAGSDEQALRSVFFDTGSAVLLRDTNGTTCLSATFKCQRPLASAAILQGAQLKGWTVAKLDPVQAYDGMVPPGTGSSVTAVPRPVGSLPLSDGWTLGWHLTDPVQPGVLYPKVVLTQNTAEVPVPVVAPAAAPTPVVAPLHVKGAGVRCEKHGDVRRVWVIGGDSPRSVCRTMYQVDKTTSVLWNARQKPQVCQEKAQAQVAREQAKGFACTRAD
ncbi:MULTISPECIES: hypothetical protein [Pseudomonas]|uniref:Uncharacterized protein n=1 Tax=Pseudomonas quercus TaxID=2722792 RepID=A0ABX0YF36_9PSED|nr:MULTISPECIES: hypothetical protein [Pseudomonas]MBF7144863.1 hypothetical protein [Pseudomonas sp. LY10J]NJP01970.1 hypothetical protein [Pseudomonas quercus]